MLDAEQVVLGVIDERQRRRRARGELPGQLRAHAAPCSGHEQASSLERAAIERRQHALHGPPEQPLLGVAVQLHHDEASRMTMSTRRLRARFSGVSFVHSRVELAVTGRGQTARVELHALDEKPDDRGRTRRRQLPVRMELARVNRHVVGVPLDPQLAIEWLHGFSNAGDQQQRPWRHVRARRRKRRTLGQRDDQPASVLDQLEASGCDGIGKRERERVTYLLDLGWRLRHDDPDVWHRRRLGRLLVSIERRAHGRCGRSQLVGIDGRDRVHRDEQRKEQRHEVGIGQQPAILAASALVG